MVTSEEQKYTCVFSPDRKYRYIWDYTIREPYPWVNHRTCLFIMCNPSTADENHRDNTVSRCVNFAVGWGFDLLIVCNIFAFRSTDPRMLKASHIEPIGQHNDEYILLAAHRAELIICAWSNQGLLGNRGNAVKELLRFGGYELYNLGVNRTGQPKHPLYIAGRTEPKLWVD